MREVLFICLIFGTHVVFSQSQPIKVLSQRWYQKYDMQLVKENHQNNPAKADVSVGGIISANEKNIARIQTNQYFVFQTVIKNESNQNIVGISWDYVFLNPAGTIERSRQKFNFFRQKIKKNKKETLIGWKDSPPNLVLDAKDYESPEAKPKEVVEINCIVFEDQTTWKREGIDENVCAELRVKIRTWKTN